MNADSSDSTPRRWPSILTWQAPGAPRMESVRVQLDGDRIRANGKILAAETDHHPAFSAYYDLQTDEAGATRRLGLTVTLAERERQLVIARDQENMWLVTDARGAVRAGYGGALDIEVVFSPFFPTLPIRRAGLHRRAAEVHVPVIYVRLPDLTVTAEATRYRSAGSGTEIEVRSPDSGAAVTVDADGFIVNYPGWAARI